MRPRAVLAYRILPIAIAVCGFIFLFSSDLQDRFNPTYEYSDIKSLPVYGISLGDSYLEPIDTSKKSDVSIREIRPDENYSFRKYAFVKPSRDDHLGDDLGRIVPVYVRYYVSRPQGGSPVFSGIYIALDKDYPNLFSHIGPPTKSLTKAGRSGPYTIDIYSSSRSVDEYYDVVYPLVCMGGGGSLINTRECGDPSHRDNSFYIAHVHGPDKNTVFIRKSGIYKE